ncbi:MAG: hypothetical protein K8H88_10890 [Sandaracinaceae bacterium]|nr:hypothetical protein [Sandaracinaceae bacterium]
MSSSKTGHLGKAGHHAVMAELLLRGWNVAIPEVDVGDDVFVVDDNADAVLRVQVKTTATKGPLDGNRPFKAQYGGLSRRDLDVSTLPFFYVFVLRVDHFWEFVVIDRAELKRRLTSASSSAGSRASPASPSPSR